MHVSERNFLKECIKENPHKNKRTIKNLYCFFCVLLISTATKHKLCREPSTEHSYQVDSNWRGGFREED